VTETISELAMRAKADAALVVDRHVNPSQKKASLALYGVLGSCMLLCERCERDPAERTELERLFAEQPKTEPDALGRAPRRYVEKGSDIYQIVCRFVFTDTDRTNAARYAAALRMAGELQIGSADLVKTLTHGGGVNALYFRRKLDAREIRTSTLRLTEQITFSRDAPLSLILQWTPDNSFRVMSQDAGRFPEGGAK